MTTRKFAWSMVILAILMSLVISKLANAGDVSECIERVKTNNGIYLVVNCDTSAHIYWASYDIAYNYGSIKGTGTHSDRYMDVKNRPPKTDQDGNLTPNFLRWLSKLNYTHLTEKGETITLLNNSGLDKVRTEKSGKFYYYVWKNDGLHLAYLMWCEVNGVSIPNK